MSSPPHDESELLPGRRRKAAMRVAALAARLNLAVFLMTFADTVLPGTLKQVFAVAGNSAEERKAHADQIAERLGAATEWRNGYYMAMLAAPDTPVEIHFSPPVFASDITSEPGKAA